MNTQKGMMNLKLKRKTKNLIGWIAGGLALVVALSFVGNFSGGFQNLNPRDWEIQQVNEDNLIKVENYTIEQGEYKTGTGIIVDVKKDGTFILDGEHGGSEDLNIEIGTVELAAGTYTFESGYKKAGLYNAYLQLVTDSGVINADFDNPVEIEAETTAKLVLVVCPEKEFNNARFAPTLALGDEAIDFFE